MKKILLMVLVVLAPISVFGQKFGLINSQELIPLMPEYTQAQTELQTLGKQYEDELKYLEEEFSKKRDEYTAQAATLPDNIRARREQELQESQQKAAEFYNDCQENYQRKTTELMNGITDKLNKAIQKVGEDGGYMCIFDASSGAVPFVSSTLTTDVTEQVKAALGIKQTE